MSFLMETNEPYIIKPIGERVAVLETELKEARSELTEIKEKLDELLLLKAKGMGALTLVSLLIGSGLVGIIYTVIKLFGSPHL